jgi:putative CocE/NonD family hydrolase
MPVAELASRLITRAWKLPPAETHAVAVERHLKVPMPDGVTLLADRYYPRQIGDRPTILVRTPYGRSGYTSFLYGWPFAERGFQVLIQSCRGTFGSGGELNPFRQERADGLATVDWLKRQAWFNGQLATVGQSYLGFTQWAIARDAGPSLKAMATWVASADYRSSTYPGGALALESRLSWACSTQQKGVALLGALASMFRSQRQIEAAYRHLPLAEADQVAIGKPISFWREWLVHEGPEDEWWAGCDFSDTIPEVTAPNHLGSGWYDVYLPQTIGAYLALKEAGGQPYLTIGPWPHADMESVAVTIRESIAWCRAHLLGDRSGLRDLPVRIFVMGAGEWRYLPAWPPSGAKPQRWHLRPAGGLAPDPPPDSEPDRYRYDPADPTPNVGGASMGRDAGPRDNRAPESRPDVLVYTSASLDRDLEVIGAVSAEIWLRSNLEHTDLFARLCDVEPSGTSTNVCDGLLRLTPGRPAPNPDGCIRVCLDLWPTAYRFRRGHRLRLQVSSGAFPRWARNLGSGEPLATGTTLKAADQAVYHDPAHPSAILLPIVE